MRYLQDIKSSLPSTEPVTPRNKPTRGWLGYLSVDSMGLSEFAQSSTLLSFPLSLLPDGFLPTFLNPSTAPSSSPSMVSTVLADREAELETQRAEAERTFLTYSWWILNEGWRGIAARVEESVERVFGGSVTPSIAQLLTSHAGSR